MQTFDNLAYNFLRKEHQEVPILIHLRARIKQRKPLSEHLKEYALQQNKMRLITENLNHTECLPSHLKCYSHADTKFQDLLLKQAKITAITVGFWVTTSWQSPSIHYLPRLALGTIQLTTQNTSSSPPINRLASYLHRLLFLLFSSAVVQKVRKL